MEEIELRWERQPRATPGALPGAVAGRALAPRVTDERAAGRHYMFTNRLRPTESVIPIRKNSKFIRIEIIYMSIELNIDILMRAAEYLSPR
jgi:hypothetical protein